MRVLFLSQRIPYPPNRGDKILSWRLVERLSRNHQVTVIAFAHDDYVYRGVKALLRSGQVVRLVTEASGSAMGDPTYTRNELLQETGWANTIARAIATWANAEYEDLI